MGDTNGWIKLHRKLLENPIMQRPNYLALWIHLLLMTNHKENKFIWNGKVMIIREGQLITGRKELSIKTGIPEGSIDRLLNFFENEHQIEQQKTTKFRLITVLNWKKYQEVIITSNNKRTTNEQQTNTNNNIKNDKKVISKEITRKREPNPLINEFIKILTSYSGKTTLDDSQSNNRKYAYLVIKHKILPEFLSRAGRAPTDGEVSSSLTAILVKADNFHASNLTNFKYLYYNFNKIINSGNKILIV